MTAPAGAGAGGGAAGGAGEDPGTGTGGLADRPAGLVDHHVHFLATAAARLSVDVAAAASVAEIVAAIRAGTAGGGGRRAAGAGGGGWVRAWGYDEAFLAEQRHPTRADLDAAGEAPTVLHHRSGHAAVLNSAALAEVGEPDHPDGVLFDRHDLLGRVPRLEGAALRQAAAATSRAWAVAGIAGFTDATHTNGAPELELLADWVSAGVVTQRVTAMVGVAHLDEVPGYGRALVTPAGGGALDVGAAKIMPGVGAAAGPGSGAAAGAGPGADPSAGRLADLVERAHRSGFPAAVHVVEIDVLEAVLDAFERSAPPPGVGPDRIEHLALSLPDQLPRIAATKATVVVNPSFLVHRRRKYERQLSEVERRWLVRIRSLLDAGITVRAGSDSPVTPALPEQIVAAAMAHPFSPTERVGRTQAAALLSPL